MEYNKTDGQSPLQYFLLVFALSIPFWILGAMVPDTTKVLPIKLPVSALMAFCPLIAAAILVYKKQKKQGVKKLLKLSFDFKKIKDTKWYLPVIFLMPVVAVLSFWYMKITGGILPEPQISPLSVFIFFFVFLLAPLAKRLVGAVILLILCKTGMGHSPPVLLRELYGQYGISYHTLYPNPPNSNMDSLAMYRYGFFAYYHGLDI